MKAINFIFGSVIMNKITETPMYKCNLGRLPKYTEYQRTELS